MKVILQKRKKPCDEDVIYDVKIEEYPRIKGYILHLDYLDLRDEQGFSRYNSDPSRYDLNEKENKIVEIIQEKILQELKRKKTMKLDEKYQFEIDDNELISRLQNQKQ